MATQSETRVEYLSDKATFTRWRDQVHFYAMSKGAMDGGMVHDLFNEDGEEEPYENELDDDGRQLWDEKVTQCIGIIGSRIANPELARIFTETWDELYTDESRKPYAVHLCLDALRANCIAVTPVTKTNAINEFKLVLRSYNGRSV